MKTSITALIKLFSKNRRHFNDSWMKHHKHCKFNCFGECFMENSWEKVCSAFTFKPSKLTKATTSMQSPSSDVILQQMPCQKKEVQEETYALFNTLIIRKQDFPKENKKIINFNYHVWILKELIFIFWGLWTRKLNHPIKELLLRRTIRSTWEQEQSQEWWGSKPVAHKKKKLGRLAAINGQQAKETMGEIWRCWFIIIKFNGGEISTLKRGFYCFLISSSLIGLLHPAETRGRLIQPDV